MIATDKVIADANKLMGNMGGVSEYMQHAAIAAHKKASPDSLAFCFALSFFMIPHAKFICVLRSEIF